MSLSASLERVPSVEAELVTDLLAMTTRTKGWPAREPKPKVRWAGRLDDQNQMTWRRRRGGRRAKVGEPSTALDARGCVRGRRGHYEDECATTSCVRDASGLRREVSTLRRCACACRLARMCGESDRLSEARTAPRSRPNRGRQRRASVAKRSPLHAGLAGPLKLERTVMKAGAPNGEEGSLSGAHGSAGTKALPG